MPKQKIYEVDNTGGLQLGEQPNIVYIPGSASKASKPALCKSRYELEEKAEENGYFKTDASYLLAQRLLSLGMQVLYQGFPLHSGEASVSEGVFTIDDVEYTYDANTITWDGGSASVDANGVATLKGGLKVKYTATEVIYPVATAAASTSIISDGDTNKFTIDEDEYTLGNNTVTWDGGSASVTNGKATLKNGLPVEIDYAHEKVFYTVVYVSDGTISIDDSDWKELEDKNSYNVRFLSTGAYACPSNAMITCAANRGDCIALIDHTNLETYSVDAVRQQIEALSGATSTNSSDPLSFASAFTPWFKADLGASDLLEVPASFGYLLAYARSVQSNPMWKAIAGVFRGVIPELKDVAYPYNNAECERLQARAKNAEVALDEYGDNVGIAINPIAYRRYSGFNGGFNYVIFGNRTMHNNDGDTVATSYLNVRALVTEVSKVVYDACIKYTFEQNTDILWSNFKADITPTLNKMQSGEGIEGYRIERVPTTKKARLCARIYLSAIPGLEDVEIGIYLENSTEEASVTIAQ